MNPTPGLVELIRKGVGVAGLNLKWMPNEARQVWTIREVEEGVNSPSGPKGCWAVVMKTKVMEKVLGPSGPVYHLRTIPDWPVYVLDGRGGFPLDPGTWIIEVLCRSDMTRHGNNRTIELDEARERCALNDLAVSTKDIKEISRDRDFYRLVKAAANEHGVPNLLKEEIVAMERQAANAWAADEEAQKSYLKGLRVHGHS